MIKAERIGEDTSSELRGMNEDLFYEYLVITEHLYEILMEQQALPEVAEHVIMEIARKGIKLAREESANEQ